MTTLTVQIPVALRRQTQRVARQRDEDVSTLVRRALESYLVAQDDLVAAYAEFAVEERALAQLGQAHYAAVLAREEAAA
jgi:predicted transcriptional regulator